MKIIIIAILVFAVSTSAHAGWFNGFSSCIGTSGNANAFTAAFCVAHATVTTVVEKVTTKTAPEETGYHKAETYNPDKPRKKYARRTFANHSSNTFKNHSSVFKNASSANATHVVPYVPIHLRNLPPI